MFNGRKNKCRRCEGITPEAQAQSLERLLVAAGFGAVGRVKTEFIYDIQHGDYHIRALFFVDGQPCYVAYKVRDVDMPNHFGYVKRAANAAIQHRRDSWRKQLEAIREEMNA